MATATSMTFTVQGLHCTGCADTLGSALRNLDGVIRARVDYETGQMEVRFDPDRVSEDDVRERIRDSGFEPD
ncbi:copper chaperone CopZ [bacterium BMS3Abin02]|nr:copper chaperone CopZ [bacterium BMS3Abin02]HDK45026.1 heavy-metal-associated domain-containing protein [Actinomycetota bacterium]